MTTERWVPRIADEAPARPFWEYVKARELRIQRCNECGRMRFPPSPTCANCLSDAAEWVRASGKGKVWSWVEFYQPYFRQVATELPYAVVMVELEEGPFMLSNLIGPASELSIGAPLEVVFDELTADVVIPKFRLAAPRR